MQVIDSFSTKEPSFTAKERGKKQSIDATVRHQSKMSKGKGSLSSGEDSDTDIDILKAILNKNERPTNCAVCPLAFLQR